MSGDPVEAAIVAAMDVMAPESVRLAHWTPEYCLKIEAAIRTIAEQAERQGRLAALREVNIHALTGMMMWERLAVLLAEAEREVQG